MTKNFELSFWGKASPHGQAEVRHPLVYHCLDVAAAFEALVEADARLASDLAAPFQQPATRILPALCALVALHDIGKVDVKFQAKSEAAWRGQGDWPGVPAPYDHAAGGMKLFERALKSALDELIADTDYFTRAALLAPIAYHHGKPLDRLGGGSTLSRGVGEQAQRVMAAILSAFDGVAPLPPTDAAAVNPASWRLAGLVSLADWIGSSTDFFPYQAPHHSPRDYWREIARPGAKKALARLGLALAAPNPEVSYKTLLAASCTPGATQRYCRDLRLPEGPTLVFIEDITGSGKTEAALLLAQRMMLAGKGRGLFVALPTMATANAMYARMSTCYRHLFSANASPSLALAHGRARLHDGFRASILPNGGRPEGEADGEIETVQAACSAFFADDRRKALLADVGVGTIDQALLAVLPTKYATLRQFGLSDKILLVDEAHAYDAYMSRELERLLTFHAGMGASAIILSATLPRRMKDRYASAFFGAQGGNRVSLTSAAYPLATVLAAGEEHRETALDARADLRRRVPASRLDSMEQALDRIADAAMKGAAVAYIRNSVDDAIEAVEALQRRGLDPMLFHARFAMCDRLKIEDEVLAIFGKRGTPAQRAGRILVATQVAEQSLDLDFDLLVSDLAPIDLLIQRAGRLWRHSARERPLSAPEFLVVSPEPAADAQADWFEKALPRASWVYRAHALLWLGAKKLFEAGALVSPDGVRGLIEAVYGEDARELVPLALQPNFDEMEGAAFGDASHAENNLLDFFAGYCGDHRAWSSDIATPTRLGDEQTLFRLALWEDGVLRPYAEDPDDFRAWALSEVSLRASRATGRGLHEQAIEGAAQAVEAVWRKAGDRAVVLPLLGAPFEGRVADRRGLEKSASYDPRRGLALSSGSP
ncbi:MAG: CRISPR-associated helicase Cas3' [Methylocystis sp.]|uniref:CRISPR-associated helicase Cas3' n=1 Tax=Methylocystis sp. TaxID=1911079 RepID=UPI003DA317E9